MCIRDSSYTVRYATTEPSTPTDSNWSAPITVSQSDLDSGTIGAGGVLTWRATGLAPETQYFFMVIPNCVNTSGTPGNTNGTTNIPLSGWPSTHVATTLVAPILGCTCNLACNYDATANQDNGTCSYACYGCMDNTYTEYNASYSVSSTATNGTTQNGVMTGCTMNDCDSNPVSIGCACANTAYYGCTDNTAQNYDPNANVDDGSCWFCSYGCTDSSLTWDATANAGSTVAATNYNASYTCDDGNCTYTCSTVNAGTSAIGYHAGGVLNIEVDHSDISSNITGATLTTTITAGVGAGSNAGPQTIESNWTNTAPISASNYNPWQDAFNNNIPGTWNLTTPANLQKIKDGIGWTAAGDSGYITVDTLIVYTDSSNDYAYPDCTDSKDVYVEIGLSLIHI